MKTKKIPNLTSKLPDGRLKVNKAAVMAHLIKVNKAMRKAKEMGALPVSQREIEAEARDLTRNNLDNLINTSEE